MQVLGDAPVSIDFVSDPKVNFAHAGDGEDGGGGHGRKEVSLYFVCFDLSQLQNDKSGHKMSQ